MTDKELLSEIAENLEQWAIESQNGGWSTHQVKPQIELAATIKLHLYDAGVARESV